MHDVRRPNYRYREAQTRRPRRKHWLVKLVVLLVILGALGAGGFFGWKHFSDKPKKAAQTASTTSSSAGTTSTQTNSSTSSNKPAVNQCAANTGGGQLIVVSISQRHLWACQGTSSVFDSAVVTGMENLAADLTPTGTYHITSKTTDTHLIGHDSTGSWDDFVNYWMPFLHNQYGSYGFHDATWRPANAFGNIKIGRAHV